MKVRNVAVCIFYDEDLHIIVQERGAHSRAGEKYGLFGGEINEGESKEEAIMRELKEELDFQPSDIKFWTDYQFTITSEGKLKGWLVNLAIFLCPAGPELDRKKDLEGDGIIKLPIDDAIKHENEWFGGVGILKRAKEQIVK